MSDLIVVKVKGVVHNFTEMKEGIEKDIQKGVLVHDDSIDVEIHRDLNFLLLEVRGDISENFDNVYKNGVKKHRTYKD